MALKIIKKCLVFINRVTENASLWNSQGMFYIVFMSRVGVFQVRCKITEQLFKPSSSKQAHGLPLDIPVKRLITNIIKSTLYVQPGFVYDDVLFFSRWETTCFAWIFKYYFIQPGLYLHRVQGCNKFWPQLSLGYFNLFFIIILNKVIFVKKSIH